MKTRCNNPNYPEYKYWGGRGIKICKRWYQFSNFLLDMGEKPEGKSLDRFPHKNGNYSKRNCRWATPLQQTLNRRPDKGQKRGKNTRGTIFEPRNTLRPWTARIRTKGKLTKLGYFRTEEEGHLAYEKAKQEADRVQ